MTATRVLVVDDHPIVRYGFAQLLSVAPDLEVCGQAADAASALELLSSARPDVILVDVSLGKTNGIDLIRELKDKSPEAAVLVVSIHDEQLYAERAMRAGASGYIMKQEATETLVQAIRTVAGGGTFASAAATPVGSPLEGLSDRELQVLEQLGRGLGTRAIAEQLAISVKTVESYRARLKEKLNLRSGTELVRFAVRWLESRGDH